MTGAYVAKPEADATPPDVPDGWNPDWPHPGPDPPGYTPEYSLSVTVPEIINFDGYGAVTLNLLDHVAYATDEPGSGVIAWSATIDDEPVNIRFSGGSEYASSIESPYSDIGDYWGAEPAIEFELTEGNRGDTVVLTAQSTVEGQAISDSGELAVNVYSLFLAGYAELKYSAASDTIAILQEGGEFVYDPDGPPGVVTFAASIDGEPVNLRDFHIGGDYASSLEAPYFSFGGPGGPWLALPTLEFDLIVENAGDTMVVAAQSTVGGAVISDSFEVLITAV